MSVNPTKLRLVYIEDEVEFRETLIATLKAKFEITGIDVGKFILTANGGEAAEQFRKWFEKEAGSQSIDGVILDSDLSGYSNGISKEMLLATFRSIGIPVCRYSKRQKQSPSERLKYFATLASEGAASALVPAHLLNGETDDLDRRTAQLIDWLYGTFEGFSQIRKMYFDRAKDGSKKPNVAELMASLLKKPTLELDLVGYTGASLFFFGDAMNTGDAQPSKEISARGMATKLGYWLLNYVIAFPGPILNQVAASAFVGVKGDSVKENEFESVFGSAKYQGPFHQSEALYYRDSLEALLLREDSTGYELLKAAGASSVKPIYDEDPSMPGVYCVATNASLKIEECEGPFDWIPSGANELCRIEKKTYDRFMPWLNV